jgi:ketosteroid isomerase-like protein
MSRLLSPLLLLLLACAPAAAQDLAPDHARTVRDFVAASNRHDVAAMLAATDPEFRWVQVVGDRATVEVAGHSDLKNWLESYFGGTPDAHSELQAVQVHGAFASTVETTRWTNEKGGLERQSATSVYEFGRDGRIRFVWYFSAQPAPAAP